MKRIWLLPIALLFISMGAGLAGAPKAAAESRAYSVGEHGLVKYPNIGALCPDQGYRDAFATCLPQQEIFQEARAHAARSGKLLLVDYGANWCVWCLVVDRYLEGEAGVGEEGDDETNTRLAQPLGEFVADTFVMVHLNADKKAEVNPLLTELGAGRFIGQAVPAFIVLDPKSGAFEEARLVEAEKPQSVGYIGYDRAVILKELLRAASAVSAGS